MMVPFLLLAAAARCACASVAVAVAAAVAAAISSVKARGKSQRNRLFEKNTLQVCSGERARQKGASKVNVKAAAVLALGFTDNARSKHGITLTDHELNHLILAISLHRSGGHEITRFHEKHHPQGK
jgi:hypothetical protein